MVKKIALTLAALAGLLQGSLCCHAETYDYGLGIISYPSTQEQMTGVALEGGQEFRPKGSPFTISFSVYTRPENVFGTIMRIITDKGDNVDLGYTARRDDVRNPMLVNGEYVTDLQIPAPIGRWADVSITLDSRTGNVDLLFDGCPLSIRDAGTKSAKGFKVYFGLCPDKEYRLDDVASVDIKDVEVSFGDKLVRRWSMGVHEDKICYDDLAHSPAVTRNPRWLLDKCK